MLFLFLLHSHCCNLFPWWVQSPNAMKSGLEYEAPPVLSPLWGATAARTMLWNSCKVSPSNLNDTFRHTAQHRNHEFMVYLVYLWISLQGREMTVGNSSDFDGRNVRVTWHVNPFTRPHSPILFLWRSRCDLDPYGSRDAPPMHPYPEANNLWIQAGHILSNMHYT